MSGRSRARQALKSFSQRKQDKTLRFSGLLGVTQNGAATVEIPSRPGFVWVRLRNNLNELIQAYNNGVSPVYDLPVMVERLEGKPNYYVVVGRDLARYSSWGSSSNYLPKHGWQHAFTDDASGGGDVTWVYGRQFMPLQVHPSGSSGAGNVVIEGGAYYQDRNWRYVGITGTADLLQYKPTGAWARMVLVYLDAGGIPTLLPDDTFFAVSITGTGAIVEYLPALPNTNCVPLAGVRLVSGTAQVLWDNLYDLRPHVVGDGMIPTGTSSVTIRKNDGADIGTRARLNFHEGAGISLDIADDGGNAEVDITLTYTGTICTYQRVGRTQPTGASTTGTYWTVPGYLYATGTLAVFNDGHILVPEVDYEEQYAASGTYHYLFTPATGVIHVVTYGIPSRPQ